LDKKCSNSDSKYIVSGSLDFTVRIWNIEEKQQETVFEGHSSLITSLTITSDSKYIVSGSDDKSVRVWDVKEKRQTAVLKGHTSDVISVAITSGSILFLDLMTSL
jgi:WD40 repeat protein